MRQTATVVLFVVVLAATVPASAATFGRNDFSTHDYSIDAEGVVVIDNPFGNVDVLGVDDVRYMTVAIKRIVAGADQAAIEEGRDQTNPQVTGDQHTRLVKTQVPLLQGRRWSSLVNYSIRVPRGVSVKIVSNSSEFLRVSRIRGSVSIKNWNGSVALDHVVGAAVVDSLNGDISYTGTRPTANIMLNTVNGSVEMNLPSDATFKWIAETLKGDFLSTFPVSGKYDGKRFIGVLNAGANPLKLQGVRMGADHLPTVTTRSITKNVLILKNGTRAEQAQSARATAGDSGVINVPMQTFQKAAVDGDFYFATNMGNISVGRVRGAAKVETRAGEVQLGLVTGQCDIVSYGGPLTLGEILGPLTARTAAGDILINAVRRGGTVATGGGMIRILAASGSLNLHSEGGDIIVGQAFGPVTALTRSGDVVVSLDPSIRQDAIDLRSSQGTIVLNVSPNFGADIDATVLTADPESNPIHSDIAGLTIRREAFAGKTRIHATGKVNGGGERVVLSAEEGDININVQHPAEFVAPGR